MRFETKIFGPLSPRQFIILGLGLIIIYFANEFIGPNLRLPVSILVGLITLRYVFSQKNDAFTKENLQKHKREIGSEKFAKFCESRIAELQSQIYIREHRGMASNPELEDAIKMLKEVRDSF